MDAGTSVGSTERFAALSAAQPRLRRRGAEVPYDRSALKAGIVHLGVGRFHRAHQAVYLDELAAGGISSDWGVIGVGLRSGRLRALESQDWIFTVLEREADGDRVRTVGSLLRYLSAPDDPQAVLEALAAPETKVVSLTVTGDGYNLDRESGELDAHDPEIVADLLHPESPSTVPGYLVEGLRLRRDRGLEPFTVLCCDNLPDNGAVSRRCVLAYAGLRDAALARWISENVTFPSTVVDRITPQTPPEARRLLAREFGIEDRWPVVTERFSQWIIEDDFCAGRPPLDEVGAQFVADAAPYELIKKRLLNGAHCALGYLGVLAGFERIDEAVADPAVSDFALALMRDEIAPLLPEVPGTDIDAYMSTLLRRFANPRIGDRLERLCARGSTKMPAYLLPSLSEALERDRPRARLVLALAGWVRYLRGFDLDGNRIEVDDVLADRLRPLARIADHNPQRLLAETEVFGDLGSSDELATELGTALRALDQLGPRRAMKALDAEAEAVAA